MNAVYIAWTLGLCDEDMNVVVLVSVINLDKKGRQRKMLNSLLCLQ